MHNTLGFCSPFVLQVENASLCWVGLSLLTAQQFSVVLTNGAFKAMRQHALLHREPSLLQYILLL